MLPPLFQLQAPPGAPSSRWSLESSEAESRRGLAGRKEAGLQPLVGKSHHFLGSKRFQLSLCPQPGRQFSLSTTSAFKQMQFETQK